jgi:hypothetical protein
MKTAHLHHADGKVEKKHFEGAPTQKRFAYKKDDNGSIIGRVYFHIDPDQNLKSDIIHYTETTAPERQ